MNRQYLHLDSRTTAYYDSAPGNVDARVLLLLHAFPLGAGMWEPQFRSIPEGWRFVAPDFRGFGGSTLDDGEHHTPSIDDYAADTLALMAELGIGSAVIAGLSMGGYVAFAMLRQAADRVSGLILADTRAGADTLEGRGNRRNMLALLDREGASGVARDMMPRLLGKTTLEEKPEVEATVRRLVKGQSPAAIRGAIVRMMERPDSTELLKTIHVPTLVMVGDEDVLTPPAESERMAALIEGAESVVIPRTGHLANLEQPEKFSTAVAAFLERL